MKLSKIEALQVLDSRGYPTLRVSAVVRNGKKQGVGVFTVPAGVSRGEFEVTEKRDDDGKKYLGYGVETVAEKINMELSKTVKDFKFSTFEEFDRYLLELDPTGKKTKLGGNLVLGLSVAVAKAVAAIHDMDLFKLLRAEYDNQLKPALRLGSEYDLPVPAFNIYNGGVQADNQIGIQEFLLIPKGIKGFSDQVRAGCEIYHRLRQKLRISSMSTSVGDEGGFCADWGRDEEVLELLGEMVDQAGYKLGQDIFWGLDIAASQYYRPVDNIYIVPNWGKGGFRGGGDKLIRFYWRWLSRFPVVYTEDLFAEDDWQSWAAFSAEKRKRKIDIDVVGDDLTATQTERLEKAVSLEAIDGISIKPNQVGTIIETLETCAAARQHDVKINVAARSGDTSDTFITDLAQAVNADYLIAGAPARGERTAKYNRLFEIQSRIS